jgi:hypothetical protein
LRIAFSWLFAETTRYFSTQARAVGAWKLASPYTVAPVGNPFASEEDAVAVAARFIFKVTESFDKYIIMPWFNSKYSMAYLRSFREN